MTPTQAVEGELRLPRQPAGEAARRTRTTMKGRVVAVIAGAALTLGVTGCSATGGSPTGNVGYWLVKVQGNYANVYVYSASAPPWHSDDPSHAVYLGANRQDANTHLGQAARTMGIPLSHIKYV